MSHQEHIDAAKSIQANVAIITLSDTRTPDTDTSGQLMQTLLTQDGHSVTVYRLIPDDPGELRTLLSQFTTRPDVDAIITNGGTGISARDQTIPTIEKLLQQPLPGFGELFRMLSWQQIGAAAMLSRATAGVINGKVLFALPGSTKAVELAMQQLILPQLRHILHQLRK